MSNTTNVMKGSRSGVQKLIKNEGAQKPKAGVFCLEVRKIMTLEGEPKFRSLARLMAGLLSIPCSNADSEREFSILRKIHTDQRPTLKQLPIN